MLLRRLAVLFVLSSVVPALAAPAAFTKAAFEKAQKDGAAVLVVVGADWCPTCRAQEAGLKQVLAEKEFAGVSTYRVDFDAQKDAVTMFKARSQSTLILFKQGKEVARTVGDSDPEALRALLKRAL